MNRQAWEMVAIVAAVSFSLHLFWENAQAPLFAGYQNFWQHLPSCLRGTAGDVAVTFLVYALVAAGRRDVGWALRGRGVDYVASGLLGAAIAVGLEWQALASGRWSYTAAMPLLPVVDVGLLPVLQMAILLPLTFWLAGRSLRRQHLAHP